MALCPFHVRAGTVLGHYHRVWAVETLQGSSESLCPPTPREESIFSSGGCSMDSSAP